MKRKNLILVLIILIGLLLRIFQLGMLPSILNRDEAALAYNGYLISETGRDEWGEYLPLALKSFGDYKLPGYPYLLAGLFSFLPETDFVVRLPSAIAGTVLIYLAYLWSVKLKLNSSWQLLVALFVSLTPIFIYYSRMAWEANLALSLFIGSLYLLFDFEKKTTQDWQLSKSEIVAVILMLAAVLTYNSPLLYLPFVIVALIWDRGLTQPKKWLATVLLLAGVLVFSGLTLFGLSSQKSGITIFTDETVWSKYTLFRQAIPSYLRTVVGNRYVYWVIIMVQNFIRSFDYRYLVTIGGQQPWHDLPQHAHLYRLQYLLGLIGTTVALLELVTKWIRDRVFNRPLVFILLAALISLGPSVITVDAPHPTRSLAFFFWFSLLSVYGLKFIMSWIGEQWGQRIVKLAFQLAMIILAFETSLYLHQYFVEFRDPFLQRNFKPGYNHLIQEIDDKYLDQPVAITSSGYQYIVTAWYLKLSPAQFAKSLVRQQADRIGFYYGERLANYHFIASPKDRSSKEKVLIQWNDDLEKWQINTYP